MNKNAFLNSCLIMTAFLIGASTSLAQVPEVFSAREISLKEGVDATEFHEMAKESAQQLAEKSLGMYSGLMKGDRGSRDGKYLATYGFMYKAARDYYFPTEDAKEYPQIAALQAKMSTTRGTSMEDMVTGGETYTDYVMLGFNQIIDPKGGSVVSMHEIDIKAGNEAAFEKFALDQLIPAWQEKVDGMYIYVFKGDRGERKGKYLYAIVFDSVERRDAYFPAAGEGPSDLLASQSEGMWFDDIAEKLGITGLGTNYTDYVFIN